MKNIFTLLLLFTILLSCTRQNNEVGIIISGRIISPKSHMVYLNEVNHFNNLNENYTIDSTSVSETGEFVFKKHNLQSKLITIATESFKPYTYQIYSTAPQTYFFENCEKFFTSIPTFYITDEDSLNINWIHIPKGIDSISSPDQSAALQIKLREFYLGSKKPNSSSVNYDNKVDFKKNWRQMLIEKDNDIKNTNFKNIEDENSFDNYLYTEVYLGHLNRYLNWFEEHYYENVEASLKNPNSQEFYSNIFSNYNMHEWNSKSLEYYKFTERYVNHYMNIDSRSFKHYYKPSEQKRKIAKKFLDGKNRKRYLALINEQLKNGL